MILVSQAKSYSFNSVGNKKSTYDQNEQLKKKTPPIGIKTPVELGSSDDGIFKMNYELKDQIRDNLSNLILTNHNERLNFPDFGANLKPLLHELATEDGDTEAMRRIQQAVAKYLPYVSLENFIMSPEDAGTSATSQIKMTITYSIPTANVTNQSLSITFNFTG
jgi:phage baseplate assembly protein W